MEDRNLIFDASVIIDMAFVGMIEKIDLLTKTSLKTSDMVASEVVMKSNLPDFGFEIIKSEMTEINNIYSSQKGKSVSFNDISALWVAVKENGVLITGDKKLRKMAEERGIETHGTLWVLDLMVIEKIISISEADESFEFMIQKGSRIPRDEFEKMKEKWKLKGL